MKKYVHKDYDKGSPGWGVGSVIFENEDGVLIKWEKVKEPVWWSHSQVPLYLKEYKEPRRLEGWVNVYEDNFGIAFGVVQKNEDSANRVTHYWGAKKIGTVKFEWVEGQNPK